MTKSDKQRKERKKKSTMKCYYGDMMSYYCEGIMNTQMQDTCMQLVKNLHELFLTKKTPQSHCDLSWKVHQESVETLSHCDLSWQVHQESVETLAKTGPASLVQKATTVNTSL